MDPQQTSPPQFASSDSFSFVPTLLDVQGLDMSFRLRQWGGGMTAGRCTVIVANYVAPSFDNPAHSIEIHQRDLANSKVIPDWQSSDEGRQEAELQEHQRLYPFPDRELWFHHAGKRVITLEALPGTEVIMDSWHGLRRNHQMFRAFIEKVVWHSIFSGFTENEAMDILRQRLTLVTPDSQLAMWHDEQNRKHVGGPFHV